MKAYNKKSSNERVKQIWWEGQDFHVLMPDGTETIYKNCWISEVGRVQEDQTA